MSDLKKVNNIDYVDEAYMVNFLKLNNQKALRTLITSRKFTAGIYRVTRNQYLFKLDDFMTNFVKKEKVKKIEGRVVINEFLGRIEK